MFNGTLVPLFLGVYCLFCSPVNGQLPPHPSSLFSDDSLMFIDIPDAGENLVKLKTHYYDVFYRRAIETGRLKPLELPFGSPLRANSKQHWLLDVMSCFKQSDNRLIKELNELTRQLGSKRPELSLEEEDSIVAKFSKMFPGRIVIAIEDKEPGFACAFGIEYAPDEFDWYEELKLVADAQPRTTKNVIVGDAGGITIRYSPIDELYFFSHKNVLYGVCDSDIEFCEQLARRVMGSSKHKSLEKSRYFKRVLSQLNGNSSPADEILCYIKFPQLLERQLIGFLDPSPPKPIKGEAVMDRRPTRGCSKDLANKFISAYGANCIGISLNLGQGDNEFEYKVVYPLLQPVESHFKKMLAGLESINADVQRFILRGMATSVFIKHGKLDLPMPFEGKGYWVGSELSPRLWRIKSLSPRKYQDTGLEDEWNKRIPNPLSFLQMANGEICKYSLSLYPDSVEFFDELSDGDEKGPIEEFNNHGLRKVDGYFFPSKVFESDQELKDSVALMFDSKLFQQFKKTSGLSKTPKNKPEPNKTEEPEFFEIQDVGQIQKNEIKFVQARAGSLNFVTAQLEDGILMFRDPGYEQGLRRLTERLSSNKRTSFNVENFFSKGISKFGDLKAVVVHDSEIQYSMADVATLPVAQIFLSWRYGKSYILSFSTYQRNLLETEQSALMKAARHLTIELFSVSGQSQVTFGARPLRAKSGNELSICCLVVSKAVDGIQYHGLFRYTDSSE